MSWTEIPDIELYADGGAEPNPGRGGYGIILSYKGVKKEFSQGYELTTNNRMELMGVIHGLQKLKTKSCITVFSDSQYVINGIVKGWARKWKTKNWYRTRSEKASNYDLWERLLNLIDEHEKVTFQWLKGHAGHTENERCDVLAMEALSGNDLLIDEGYQSANRDDSRTDIENANAENSVADRARGTKVIIEGDPCRKCNVGVIKKPTKKKEAKAGQKYYFEFYLLCPACKTMYMVEEAKRPLDHRANDLFA